MKITASMVSELRTKTGAGMMDCKKALAEADGNMEAAVDILRKKGLSAAAKKADRAAAEGLVVGFSEGSNGVLVEVNAETDFVAKNSIFQDFANGVANVVLSSKPVDLDALKALPFPGTGRSIAEEQVHQIATIGENINLRRFVCYEAGEGVASVYIHGAGKIGVMVELKTAKSADDKVAALGRNLAMHIAAANPPYLCRDEVPADIVEKEKEIMRSKALASGKPENIVDKIIVGQINKYFGDVCLLEQAYVIDPDQTVAKVVESLGKELGADIKLTRFSRFQLGDGVEKRSDDFAAEVASMTK